MGEEKEKRGREEKKEKEKREKKREEKKREKEKREKKRAKKKEEEKNEAPCLREALGVGGGGGGRGSSGEAHGLNPPYGWHILHPHDGRSRSTPHTEVGAPPPPLLPAPTYVGGGLRFFVSPIFSSFFLLLPLPSPQHRRTKQK